MQRSHSFRSLNPRPVERQLVGTSDDRCPSYAVSSRSQGRRQKRDLAEELEVLRHCFKSEHERINIDVG